jgi:hypothetical protein
MRSSSRTPNMHKVHHHYQQPLTDSNYGNIFAFWDRLFGTYRKVEDTKSLTYGIDTHIEAEENNNLSNLLLIPFQPYRNALNPEKGRVSSNPERTDIFTPEALNKNINTG